MSKKLHVAPSPLTNRIFCGHVLKKDGMYWLFNKTDVTGEACAAVAKHAIATGGVITVTENGTPAFRISVERIFSDDYSSEALAALMTACYRSNVRGQNWTAVERSFQAALDADMKPDAALDHALALMKQIVGGNDGQR